MPNLLFRRFVIVVLLLSLVSAPIYFVNFYDFDDDATPHAKGGRVPLRFHPEQFLPVRPARPAIIKDSEPSPLNASVPTPVTEPPPGNSTTNDQPSEEPSTTTLEDTLPTEPVDPFGPAITVLPDQEKSILEAIQRIDDELVFDRDIQKSLRVRLARINRANEKRKEKYKTRRKRDADTPIVVYFRDGWGFWGHLGLDHPKFVQDCSVPCRATVEESSVNTAEVVLMMEPNTSNKYKQKLRDDIGNKRAVTAVVVLDPFFRAGWEPYLRNIDLLISFSRFSDVITTYAYGSWLPEDVNSTTLPQQLLDRGVLLPNGTAELPTWNEKIGDTAMFVSNCGSRWRTSYIQEIMKLTYVRSYGGCFHTEGLDGGKREDKVPIVSKHKVFLSFENTLMEDYMTEKFFEAAMVPAVSIYFGPTNANTYFPSPDPIRYPSMINGWDYRDPRKMARLIQRLTTDFEFWQSHFLWRATPEAAAADPKALGEGYRMLHDNNFIVTGPTSWVCRICEDYAKNYDFEGWEGDAENQTIVDDGTDAETYEIVEDSLESEEEENKKKRPSKEENEGKGERK